MTAASSSRGHTPAPLLTPDEWDYLAAAGAWVHKTAHLGEGCVVGPGSVIGPDVSLGARCIVGGHVRLDAGVRLRDDVHVLDGAVLYPGTTVGAGCQLLEHSHLGRWPEVAGPITRRLKPDYPPLSIGAACLLG